jgi:hypothetical protein
LPSPYEGHRRYFRIVVVAAEITPGNDFGIVDERMPLANFDSRAASVDLSMEARHLRGCVFAKQPEGSAADNKGADNPTMQVVSSQR